MSFISDVQKDFVWLNSLELPRGKRFIFLFLRHLFGSGGGHVVLIYRISSYFKNSIWGILISKYLLYRIKSKYHIEISSHALISGGFRLPHPYSIVIGHGVKLGQFCTINQFVTLGGNFGKSIEGWKTPVIGDWSWVCAGCVLAGPILIGSDVVIGANSVVTKSFPEDHLIISGNPAKIIKYRDYSEQNNKSNISLYTQYYGLSKENINKLSITKKR